MNRPGMYIFSIDGSDYQRLVCFIRAVVESVWQFPVLDSNPVLVWLGAFISSGW